MTNFVVEFHKTHTLVRPVEDDGEPYTEPRVHRQGTGHTVINVSLRAPCQSSALAIAQDAMTRAAMHDDAKVGV